MAEEKTRLRRKRTRRLDPEAAAVRSIKELIWFFFVLGGLGVVFGPVMLGFGEAMELTDPSGPFNAIFVIMMGFPMTVAGGLCLASAIGLRENKSWGRRLALIILWPMSVIFGLSFITSLVKLQIGPAAVSAIVMAYASRHLNDLYSKPIKARFQRAAPEPAPNDKGDPTG